MNSMIKIGITGNIGSGKTTICQIFERVGVPIYYADERAKELMYTSDHLKIQIQKEFGADIYFKNGKLNRKKLAQRVFNDESKLHKLNQLVHPEVYKDIQDWVDRRSQEGHKLTIEEAALTYEAGHAAFFDIMITVTAPERMLIERVMERDKTSLNEVKTRLSRQMPQHEKAMQSDIIILNDGQHSLIFQVQNIIDRWQLPMSKKIYT